MTHITTDHNELPIIRLAFNLGVEDIQLLSGAEITSKLVYMVYLNGRYDSINVNYLLLFVTTANREIFMWGKPF